MLSMGVQQLRQQDVHAVMCPPKDHASRLPVHGNSSSVYACERAEAAGAGVCNDKPARRPRQQSPVYHESAGGPLVFLQRTAGWGSCYCCDDVPIITAMCCHAW